MFIGVHFIISFSLTCHLAQDLADRIFKSSTKYYIFARVQAHGEKNCPKSKFFSLVISRW